MQNDAGQQSESCFVPVAIQPLAVRIDNHCGQILNIAYLILRPHPDLIQRIPCRAALRGSRFKADYLVVRVFLPPPGRQCP